MYHVAGHHTREHFSAMWRRGRQCGPRPHSRWRGQLPSTRAIKAFRRVECKRVIHFPRSWPEGKEQPPQWANAQPWVAGMPCGAPSQRRHPPTGRRPSVHPCCRLRSVPASYTKSEQDHLPAPTRMTRTHTSRSDRWRDGTSAARLARLCFSEHV
eukprot:scaffold8095_cov75-Phaeocystis_antarctica.AAC.1